MAKTPSLLMAGVLRPEKAIGDGEGSQQRAKGSLSVWGLFISLPNVSPPSLQYYHMHGNQKELPDAHSFGGGGRREAKGQRLGQKQGQDRNVKPLELLLQQTSDIASIIISSHKSSAHSSPASITQNNRPCSRTKTMTRHFRKKTNKRTKKPKKQKKSLKR